MDAPKSGPRFVESLSHLRRRRWFISPGVLALIGAIAGVAFMVVMLGLLEADLGFHVGDWFRR